MDNSNKSTYLGPPRGIDINGNNGYRGTNPNIIPKYIDRRKRMPDSFVYDHNETDALTTRTKSTCFGLKVGDKYNRTFFCCVAYFGAAACFLLTVNIRNLPDLWYPTIGNLLLPLNITDVNPQRVQVIIILWSAHFLRRFAEVLFVHIYTHHFKLHEAIGAIIYYCFFGLWIGWSLNIHIGYRTPPDYLFVPGILICFLGGVGNCICHLYLRAMSLQYRHSKIKNESQHMYPNRCCFNLVACPHYLFEIITWIGFSMCAFTMASWTFTLTTIVVLIIYSRNKHLHYQKSFSDKNSKYYYDPKKRKALIPFVF